MILALSPTSSRSSTMSSGFCTKDRATQHTPASRANSKSARSFSVRGEIGSATVGTFTPFLFERDPPTITLVSTPSSSVPSTSILSLPSSKSRISPGLSTVRISGWGSCTRQASPGSSLISNRNFCPSTSSTLSSSKMPTRSLGPWRSARMAMGWFHFSSTARMMSTSSCFSLCFPWLKLRRKTSAPAKKSFSIISKVELAGPRVATCFVAFFQRWLEVFVTSFSVEGAVLVTSAAEVKGFIGDATIDILLFEIPLALYVRVVGFDIICEPEN
mmetsp:Transcript_13792/g.20315  ORF Transcript_13792/g.20315 Transcript_13792/m.20315 type:complete len:273 (+) Transcript_13792:1176-1994(+)